MRNKRLVLWVVAFTLGLASTTVPVFAAGKEKLLYTFNGPDGLAPYAGLIFDPAGKLYGTTYSGGANGYGAVFQLSRGSNGTWTETVLHSFNFGSDGVLPCGGLILDSSGNLYGTTKSGGIYGYGTVFQLSPGSNGTWTETVLHNFNDEDGLGPYAGVIFDASGNLYGTTLYGGSYGNGTVFQLVPGINGIWTETVLYSFSGGSTDGANPYGGAHFDAAGNLYGTTYAGGAYGYGTVFQLKAAAGGMWSELVLHSFGKGKGIDGKNPYDSLASDRSGNLYGTTYSGGAHNYGGVFKLASDAKHKWKETVLRSFSNGKNGSYPYGGVILDAAGKLYGTSYSGGAYGYGLVFRLSRGTNGKWVETVLTSFNRNDGNGPYDGVILDKKGNLYGTTVYGGGSGCGGAGCGAVFAITP